MSDARPTVRLDTQRARVRLPPPIEACARVALAYLRNDHGLRDRRPLHRYAARNMGFYLAGRDAEQIEATMGGLSVIVGTRDRTIARSVYASGDWDPLLVGTVFRALDDFGVAYRGTTFLEIGANFGVYTLPAVAEWGFARAVAYEPDPTTFALLEANIARNALGDRVEAHNAALSSARGELLLSLGASNAGDNRIIAEGTAGGDARVVRVPARTFDDEVAAGRIAPAELGLVWLDVQGHERDVLAGAPQLLASTVPVVLEYATSMLDAEAQRGLRRLITDHFDVIVDLGWSALTGRVRFQPASAVDVIAGGGRAVETDLLLLHA